MSGHLLEFAALLLIAATSVALIAAGVMVLNTEARMAQRLRGVQSVPGDLLSHREPSSLAKALDSLLLLPGKDREEVEQYLAAAGYRDPHAPLVFGLVRLGGVVLAGLGLFFALHAAGKTVSMALLAGVMGAAAAYLLPKMVLRFSSARKKRKMQAELPFTLDVMVMMLEAGISIDQCFRTFAGTEGRAAPLVQETVVGLVRDLDLGAPYDHALNRWADRLGVTGGHELARVIQQALSQGTPLVQVLKEFAKEFSERRVAAAREAVGKMTTKMTVVMVLFILPSLLIVLAGPAFATLGDTLRNLSQ